MVDVLQNLQMVYSKWENRAKDRTPGSSKYVPHIIPGNHMISQRTMHNRFQNRRNQKEEPIKEQFRVRFKFMPTANVPSAMARPMVGLCCNCLPASQKTLLDQVSEVMGLRNMLLVDTQNSKHGYLTKKFCYIAHVMKTNPQIVYPDVGKNVLEDERILKALKSTVEEEVHEKVLDHGRDTYDRLYHKHLTRATAILESMRAAMSTALLRLTSWLLHVVLSRLHSSVVVHKGQLEMLRRAATSDLPIVYVPLHRSHLDYLLISLVLYNEELRAPLVAAGDNLRIPLFGPLLRGLGAFFIKRRLDAQDGRRRDVVYRSVLQSYVQECLRSGHHLEIFIEGSRSRSGKPCRPKGGLLSVICDAYTAKAVDDVYLVPVAISYDRLLEGNFIGEQLGEPKSPESFLGAVRSIWRVLMSRYGSVRINFGQAFSLREYVEVYRKVSAGSTACQPVCTGVNGYNQIDAGAAGRTGLQLALSSSSLYGVDVLADEQRHLVENLARHLVCDASRCISVMPTSAVAFLLLNKFRKGVTLPKLATELEKLRGELAERKVDVGFSGQALDVVNHTVSLLGPGLVRRERPTSPEVGDDLILPVTLLPNVIELAYYANSTTLPFAMDAIVATAIYRHLGGDLARYRGTPSSMDGRDGAGDSLVSLRVRRGQLIKTCLEICSIMQFEYMVVQPCVPLDSLFNAVVERFITAHMLQLIEVPYARQVRKFDWESDSEEDDYDDEEEEWCDPELQVDLNEECVDRLLFLHGLLCPVLDTYYWCLCSLEDLIGRQCEERDLQLDILAHIKQVQEQGLALYGESLSMESVRNCLKLLEQWHVLEVYCHEGMRIVYLNAEYDVEDGLLSMIEKWQHLRK